ncbi:MAG: DnaK suppressor protein [Limisphaerales bacterium]|jgi:DnaK suppressor protein
MLWVSISNKVKDMKSNEVELKLRQMREELVVRQEKLAAHVSDRAVPLPADFSEQAVELENDETMVRLLERTQTELDDIDVALDRLGKNTYSTCDGCGQEIEAERLVALPTTSVCIVCASA